MPCTNAQRQHWVGSLRRHQWLAIASGHVRPLRDVEREQHPHVGRNNGNRALTAERNRSATLFPELTRSRDGPCPPACSRSRERVVEFITSM